MKKQIFFLGIILIVFSCTTYEPVEPITVEPQQRGIVSKLVINQLIAESIESKGDFDWHSQDIHILWSALQHSNNMLSIGYGSSMENIEKTLNSEKIKDEIISLVSTLEQENIKAGDNLYTDKFLNVIDIKVSSKKTLEQLLTDSRVRYIEPSGYNYFTSNENERSSSGCGYRQQNISSYDYRSISPGAKVPWAFDRHRIPEAWNYSTGSGITVAVIDTGLSPEQKWMNSYFNDGDSSGRTVQKYGTFVDSWWYWSNNYDGVNDKCGHGSNMAAIATAPRNNDNLPVGVAYNANLVSYRAVEDVIIDDYHEKRGVAEALTALANRSDVKVISMSIGSPFSIGRVKDAIKYAYNRDKLIIAAGGTSTSFTTWYGVIFPASMDETVAVTGVKQGIYNTCDVCHSGSKIDFTIQMERTNGSNNKIPTLSYYNGKQNYVGGSSVATAMTSGIAALIWAKHPNWTRSQVLQKMKESADFYPNKNPEFGYGNIDALKAVQ